MAAITIDSTTAKLVEVYSGGAYECHSNASAADREWKLYYVIPATNKAALADANGSGTLAPIMGVSVSKRRTSLADESMTLLRHGLFYPGEDALDSMNIGDPIFASDTVGGFDTAASATNHRQVGIVYGVTRTDGSVDKLIEVDTRHIAYPAEEA